MSRRVERLNSLIRQEISELLRRDVKDPRLGNFIAVTVVVTSSDLRHADIFVSHLGSDAEKQETLRALTAASGFFRREMTKRLKLRVAPELAFRWDDSIERGDRVFQLIEKVSPQREPTPED